MSNLIISLAAALISSIPALIKAVYRLRKVLNDRTNLGVRAYA